MGDFSIKIGVRNAHILRRIKEKSIAEFCRKHDLRQSAIAGLITFRISPFLKTGELTMLADQLCVALRCIPEDLWPRQIERLKLKRSTMTVELSTVEMQAICGDAESRVVQRELLAQWAAKLSPRQIKIIGMRQSGATYEECAKEFGVARGRAQQIEAAALRKMRGAAKRSGIKSLADLT